MWVLGLGASRFLKSSWRSRKSLQSKGCACLGKAVFTHRWEARRIVTTSPILSGAISDGALDCGFPCNTTELLHIPFSHALGLSHLWQTNARRGLEPRTTTTKIAAMRNVVRKNTNSTSAWQKFIPFPNMTFASKYNIHGSSHARTEASAKRMARYV